MSFTPIQSAATGNAGPLLFIEQAFGANVGQNNLSVVCISQNQGSTAPTLVTDTVGTVYTLVPNTFVSDVGDDQHSRMYAGVLAGTGANTVHVEWAADKQFIEICVMEFSGNDATSPIDTGAGQVQSSPGTGTDAVTSTATGALAGAGELVVAWTLNASDFTSTYTHGTGFTAAAGSSASLQTQSEYRTAPSAAGIAGTFTVSANATSITIVGTFKPLATGTTVNPSGLGLTANVGSPTETSSAITVPPTGLGLAASVGGPSIHTNANTTIGPVGQGLTASVGTPIASGSANITLTPGGQGLTTSLGALNVEIDTTVLPLGMVATVALGSPTVTIVNGGGNATVTPIGLGLTASLGAQSIIATSLQQPSGLGLTASVGTPSTQGQGNITLLPVGLGLAAAVGNPHAGVSDQAVLPVGLGLLARLGAPVVHGATSAAGGAKHHHFRFGFHHGF